MRQLLLSLFCLVVLSSFAQEEEKINPHNAFENKNYSDAIKGFESALVGSPSDYDLQLKLGLCYMYSYIDRTKSIELLDKLKEKKDNNFEALYYLGRAYHVNYKFDEAIFYYQQFADSCKDSLTIAEALRQIEMCNNGKKLVANPVDVTLRNMGDAINSDAPDYNVFVDQEESILVFTSKRKKRNKSETPAEDGFYPSDILMSSFEEGAWQKPKVQSNVCTEVSEQSVGMSPDGQLMFLSIEGRGATGEMIVSSRKTGSFKEPIKVEKTVNSSAAEFTATVSQDLQKFYYCSNREGGEGGFDIYMAKRLPDRNWAIPLSVSDKINTEYDELYPQLSPDEKTLYFTSNGHNTMGGFDLFKSEWDPKTKSWGEPINLGYPINTPDDDMHFAVNVDGTRGYIATHRPDSRGDLDIYSVTFNNVEAKNSIILGNVLVPATIDYNDYQNFTVFKKDGKEYKVPSEFQMMDESYGFVRREKQELRPRFYFEATYTLEIDNIPAVFKFNELPDNYQDYPVLNVVLNEAINPNYIAPIKKSTTTNIPVKEVILEAYDMQGEFLGVYASNPNSGKFIMVLPPGKYEVFIITDGLEETSEIIEIPGNAEFQHEIEKSFIATPIKSKIIHYKNVPN